MQLEIINCGKTQDNSCAEVLPVCSLLFLRVHHRRRPPATRILVWSVLFVVVSSFLHYVRPLRSRTPPRLSLIVGARPSISSQVQKSYSIFFVQFGKWCEYNQTSRTRTKRAFCRNGRPLLLPFHLPDPEHVPGRSVLGMSCPFDKWHVFCGPKEFLLSRSILLKPDLSFIDEVTHHILPKCFPYY